jgi:hypothetical protein
MNQDLVTQVKYFKEIGDYHKILLCKTLYLVWNYQQTEEKGDVQNQEMVIEGRLVTYIHALCLKYQDRNSKSDPQKSQMNPMMKLIQG